MSAAMQVLCCKPGYGGLPDTVLRGLVAKKSSAGLISRHVWKEGSNSNWTQSVQHRGTGICRAGLEDDAPFALAIAASVLSTLVLPPDSPSEKGSESLSPLGGDDVRYAAMGIISFIPLFNWLAWVFAWLDTRKQRYLIYAIVYIAPYLRSGLSLSPEESWLPIASVLACILHVQLDISASSEGLEDLGISKALFTRDQVKQIKERADTLLLRLQQLAERSVAESSSSIASKATGEVEESISAEDISRVEMKLWDEKFSQSVAKDSSEATRDDDS